MSTSAVHTDQITISLAADGSVRGINVYTVTTLTNDDGTPAGAVPMSPRDATLADVTNLLAPSLVTQQAQITDLTAQLTAAATNAQTDAATIAQLQAQIAATPPAASVPDAADALLASLNAVFATVPAEYQAQFANEYATVRVLIQAGQPALAAAAVQGVAVPDALAAIKAEILAALA